MIYILGLGSDKTLLGMDCYNEFLIQIAFVMPCNNQ